jgi:hypothetical protein
MLEDQLLLTVVLKQNRILVEGTNLACQLDTADQIDRDGGFIFADRVEKRVLDVLCRLVIHVPISLAVGQRALPPHIKLDEPSVFKAASRRGTAHNNEGRLRPGTHNQRCIPGEKLP